MPETKQRFVVEGSWDEGNEGSPITVDWIAAASAAEAKAIVDKVRSKIDNWTHDATRTFEEYIEAQERILADMKTQTIEDVENSWAETKDNLYYEEEKVTKYAVNWDNGANACGTFDERYETEGAAQEFADFWARERNLEDLGLSDAEVEELGGEGCYTAEVIVVEEGDK